jgi:hypothetical protein
MNCERCGAEFVGRSGARFCSGRCRQAAYRARIRDGVTDDAVPIGAKPAGAGAGSVTRDALRLVPKPRPWKRGPSFVVTWARGQGWREVT